MTEFPIPNTSDEKPQVSMIARNIIYGMRGVTFSLADAAAIIYAVAENTHGLDRSNPPPNPPSAVA